MMSRRMRSSRSSAGRAATCSPTRACSTSTAARRWGRGAPRSRSPCSSARRTARSPTRTSRRCATASSPRCATSSGASSVPSVVVAGASGYTGALAARILHRHPAFDLVAVTSRSDAGRRLDDLYPYHRVPLTLEELDLDRHGEADAAIVAYFYGAVVLVVVALRA